MKLFTLYDNKAKGKFRAGWGFSCLIKWKCTILFDTGADVEILSHNARLFGIDKDEIKYCFISHLHGDHTGGLGWLKEVKVFRPGEYDGSIKGVTTLVFKHPLEQALMFEDERIMIVGCSHPGIVRMAERAYERYGKLKLIIGGMHLLDLSEVEVIQIANRLKELTELIAPCHCTGDKAIETFNSVFKERFVENYAGNKIEI